MPNYEYFTKEIKQKFNKFITDIVSLYTDYISYIGTQYKDNISEDELKPYFKFWIFLLYMSDSSDDDESTKNLKKYITTHKDLKEDIPEDIKNLIVQFTHIYTKNLENKYIHNDKNHDIILQKIEDEKKYIILDELKYDTKEDIENKLLNITIMKNIHEKALNIFKEMNFTEIEEAFKKIFISYFNSLPQNPGISV